MQPVYLDLHIHTYPDADNPTSGYDVATLVKKIKEYNGDEPFLISFTDLFKHESILIIWYDETGLITDLEHYYLSNDFDVLFKDYYYIKKAIDSGEAHRLREGDTKYLGASRLNEKVAQPNSDRLANRREFVLKKKYLQKILNEMGFRCM